MNVNINMNVKINMDTRAESCNIGDSMEKLEPPTPRENIRRITRAMKATEPGAYHELSKKTAAAFRAYGQRQGWPMAQETVRPGVVRVWRLLDK